MRTPSKIAIYARVSTQDQQCEVQLSELREYVARRGWTSAVEYVDKGVSGKKASRPALDRLMKAARRRDVDTILVSKLDRFGRSVKNLSEHLDTLARHGVRLMAVSQGLDVDSSNPTSMLLTHVLSAVAEFECEIIRERTAAGMRHAAAEGRFPGRPKRIFDRAEVARLRDAGSSWREIMRKLDLPLTTTREAYRDFKSGCAETPARRA